MLIRRKPISPLAISVNGRCFVDPSGQPVFWLGDTQWELFRLFDPPTALTLLRDRQAKGFNVILVMLTGIDTTYTHTETPTDFVNLEGEPAWIENDPLRPNEHYYCHVDEMIRLGVQTGQTFVVGVYHQWHLHTIPLEKARAWARWVANRYRDVPNLIWSMYPRATEEYRPVCRELAAGLQEGDGGAHLISVHPDPSVASSSFLQEEDWLDFHMIQTCVDYDQIIAAVTADYQRVPPRPVIMAEGGYEGTEFQKTQTAHDIRKQAYWTQLAGGYHVYGHNDAWQNPLDWKTWLDSPGSRDLARFREVITALPEWWNLTPDDSLILTGAGSGYSRNIAARSANGDWIIAYFSEPSTMMLRLSFLARSRTCRAVWINPANGERLTAGSWAVDSTPEFHSPRGWEDALLFLQAEG